MKEANNDRWLDIFNELSQTDLNTPFDKVFELTGKLFDIPRRIKPASKIWGLSFTAVEPEYGRRTGTLYNEVLWERLVSLVDSFPYSCVFLERYGLLLHKKSLFVKRGSATISVQAKRVHIHPKDLEIPCTGMDCSLDRKIWRANSSFCGRKS